MPRYDWLVGLGAAATPEWRWNKHVIVRGDLRFDRSDAQSFWKRTRSARQQLTALINLLLVK